MLVIKRKFGESFVLGEDIEITVLGYENGAVKLGIKAPKDITVLRSELIKEVENENESAIEFNLNTLKKLKLDKK
ncbi:carbon storage regulator [Clostridiaceae bacterium 14S0207]|nr:carbon storage regulator [Clostridiaceae bacterium 14S0207]